MRMFDISSCKNDVIISRAKPGQITSIKLIQKYFSSIKTFDFFLKTRTNYNHFRLYKKKSYAGLKKDIIFFYSYSFIHL